MPEPEQLRGEGDVGVTSLRCRANGPGLDLWAADLHATPALTADQMVMTVVRTARIPRPAQPVRDLAAGTAHHVDPVRLGQQPQVPVDGRQADTLATGPDLGEQVKRRTEPVRLGQRRLDTSAWRVLRRRPATAGSRRPPAGADRESRRVPPVITSRFPGEPSGAGRGRRPVTVTRHA